MATSSYQPVSPENLAAPKRSRPRLARRSARFTKRDVKRAVEAVKETGLQIAIVRIEADGTIMIVPGSPPPVPSANPWDGAS
jgi:hypothetical protein